MAASKLRRMAELRRVSPQASGRRLSSYRRPLFPSMRANRGKPSACGGCHAAAHGEPPPEESGGGADLGLAHQTPPPWPHTLRDQRFEHTLRLPSPSSPVRPHMDSPVGHPGLFGLAPAPLTGKVFTNATASSSHALSTSFVGTGGSI
jgi:hypothetical protein